MLLLQKREKIEEVLWSKLRECIQNVRKQHKQIYSEVVFERVCNRNVSIFDFLCFLFIYILYL